MHRALVERLAGVIFTAAFSAVCVAQAFRTPSPTAVMLFVLGAVFFAFVSGVLLSRKSE